MVGQQASQSRFTRLVELGVHSHHASTLPAIVHQPMKGQVKQAGNQQGFEVHLVKLAPLPMMRTPAEPSLCMSKMT